MTHHDSEVSARLAHIETMLDNHLRSLDLWSAAIDERGRLHESRLRALERTRWVAPLALLFTVVALYVSLR